MSHVQYITPWRGVALFALMHALPACAVSQPARELPPRVVPHAQWQTQPPLGHAADASRRNLRAGDRLEFRDIAISVVETAIDSTAAGGSIDMVRLRLERAGVVEERSVREGSAFNWQGYHLAIVAVYGPGELGAGLTAIEVATLESLTADVANSTVAGGAELRLRVPHRITHVTLHHTGSAEPLRPEDDPVQKLRGLQSWGASDRNWWDVPYHFLIDLDGRVYEGRDWRYMGETNTTYDPAGHFLISVIGNYERQDATQSQLDAIADLMAWAIARFDLPLDRIGGHYNYAGTTCPGQHLRKYLEDGTFRRMVQERLASRRAGSTAESVRAAAARARAHVEADVRFMHGMLAHHAQAILMTDLVEARTQRNDIRLLARRIDVSQKDEMRQMRRWLQVRGESVPDSAASHAQHGDAQTLMPGMLTMQELSRLKESKGVDFDTLFLEYMIRHHEGAVTMVAELFAAGAGQEPEIFQIASHVDADQRSEIARMRRLHAEILRRGTP